MALLEAQSQSATATTTANQRATSPVWRRLVSVNFACGWGAAAVETVVVFPFSKVIFRQQLHGFVLREALTQVRSEGAFVHREKRRFAAHLV